MQLLSSPLRFRAAGGSATEEGLTPVATKFRSEVTPHIELGSILETMMWAGRGKS